MTDLRAVVVDDEPLARDELAFLLAECGGVAVIAEACDAPSALQVCEAEACLDQMESCSPRRCGADSPGSLSSS